MTKVNKYTYRDHEFCKELNESVRKRGGGELSPVSPGLRRAIKKAIDERLDLIQQFQLIVDAIEKDMASGAGSYFSATPGLTGVPDRPDRPSRRRKDLDPTGSTHGGGGVQASPKVDLAPERRGGFLKPKQKTADGDSFAADSSAVCAPRRWQDRKGFNIYEALFRDAGGRVGQIVKYISRSGDKWLVHSEAGKVLGTHDSKESALRQLRAIEAHTLPRKAVETTAPRMMPVSCLRPTQTYLNEETVQEYVEAMQAGTALEPVVGIMRGQECFILDGHHRVTAAMRLGAREVPVELLTFKSFKGENKAENIPDVPDNTDIPGSRQRNRYPALGPEMTVESGTAGGGVARSPEEEYVDNRKTNVFPDAEGRGKPMFEVGKLDGRRIERRAPAALRPRKHSRLL